MNTYRTGGRWGDAINWMDWETHRVVGWKQRKPKVWDRLIASMESGQNLVLEFTEMEYVRDPRDMFFGRVKDIGYEDEVNAKQLPEKGEG